MGTVTKSIGTTPGIRDYSTITAWEADLDNSGVYSSGDDALGECYADSDFNEAVTINGGGTVGLNSIRLSVAAGQRHTGTENTGARIAKSAYGWCIEDAGTIPVIIEWLEFAGLGAAASVGAARPTATNSLTIRNCLGYDLGSTRGFTESNRGGTAATLNILDCICWGGQGNHFGTFTGAGSGEGTLNILNCTSYGATTDGLSAPWSGWTATAKNVSSTDSGSSNIGVGYTTATNYTTDSQGGTNYVSITGGSEDFHVAGAGSALYNAGTDLGTTPSGVEIDIDGRDRDANGDTWDIGADEYVAAAAGNPWYYYAQM
ncbi:hypothetical protein [Petrachloros mirabilis]